MHLFTPTPLESRPAPPAPPVLAPERAPRTRQFRVRRVDTSSVLRATLLFHALVVLVGLFALVLLYVCADVSGSLDNIERSVRVVAPGFRIRPVSLFTAATVLGGIEIAFATTLNVVATKLYNLVADGGASIELELQER